MDNEQIAAAVKSGMSYGEVAEIAGISRNSVAGICHRAGVKVGKRPMPASARWKIGLASRSRRNTTPAPGAPERA